MSTVRVKIHGLARMATVDAKRAEQVLAERDEYLKLNDEVETLRRRLAELEQNREDWYDKLTTSQNVHEQRALCRIVWEGESAIRR